MSAERMALIIGIITAIFGLLTGTLGVAIGWYTKVVINGAKEDILRAVREGYVSQEQLNTFSAKITGQVELVIGEAKDAILRAVKENYVSQEQLNTFSTKIIAQVEQVETELEASVKLLTQRVAQLEEEVKSLRGAIEAKL